MNRRIPPRIVRAGTIGVAALVLAGCWTMPGRTSDRRAFNNVESDLTTETVGSLTEQWTAQTGAAGAVGSPIWSRTGIHFVGRTADNQIALQTVRASTGVGLWAQTVGHEFTTPGDPVRVGDEVYLGWGLGNLGGTWNVSQFDAASGAQGPDVDGALVDTARGRKLGHHSVSFGSGGPCAGQFGVTDLDDPDLSWTGLTEFGTTGCRAVPPTIGENAVHHAGPGPNSTEPGSTTTGNGIRSFTLAPPLICAGSGPSALRCPTWATPLPGSTATPPVIGTDGSTLYTVNDLGSVYAVDAKDGTVLWSAPLGASVSRPPAVAHGSLFVPTADGLQVLAADGCGAAECAPTWTADAGTLGTQPAVAGGVVFTGGADGTVTGFPADGCGASTCDSLWSTTTGSRITGGPVVVAGQLYVGTADGRLVAYGLDG